MWDQLVAKALYLLQVVATTLVLHEHENPIVFALYRKLRSDTTIKFPRRDPSDAVGVPDGVEEVLNPRVDTTSSLSSASSAHGQQPSSDAAATSNELTLTDGRITTAGAAASYSETVAVTNANSRVLTTSEKEDADFWRLSNLRKRILQMNGTGSQAGRSGNTNTLMTARREEQQLLSHVEIEEVEFFLGVLRRQIDQARVERTRRAEEQRLQQSVPLHNENGRVTNHSGSSPSENAASTPTSSSLLITFPASSSNLLPFDTSTTTSVGGGTTKDLLDFSEDGGSPKPSAPPEEDDLFGDFHNAVDSTSTFGHTQSQQEQVLHGSSALDAGGGQNPGSFRSSYTQSDTSTTTSRSNYSGNYAKAEVEEDLQIPDTDVAHGLRRVRPWLCFSIQAQEEEHALLRLMNQLSRLDSALDNHFIPRPPPPECPKCGRSDTMDPQGLVCSRCGRLQDIIIPDNAAGRGSTSYPFSASSSGNHLRAQKQLVLISDTRDIAREAIGSAQRAQDHIASYTLSSSSSWNKSTASGNNYRQNHVLETTSKNKQDWRFVSSPPPRGGASGGASSNVSGYWFNRSTGRAQWQAPGWVNRMNNFKPLAETLAHISDEEEDEEIIAGSAGNGMLSYDTTSNGAAEGPVRHHFGPDQRNREEQRDLISDRRALDADEDE
ncbi:unnamed protein product [Amoebophrya sp. A25]|nr:unnamed protein product [Amoebophrya sp. A25]|eukprot:GSA25T00016571001.1